MTNQPKWKIVANLGDVNPIDYGGMFVYVDETGVYSPEMEILEVDDFSDSGRLKWRVYRFCLDKCTYQAGILSDNRFHPNIPAWFAKPESERAERPQDTTYLQSVADCCGTTTEELVQGFISDDPIERARSYEALVSYYGLAEFDSYPLEFTRRREVERRYAADLRSLKKSSLT